METHKEDMNSTVSPKPEFKVPTQMSCDYAETSPVMQHRERANTILGPQVDSELAVNVNASEDSLIRSINQGPTPFIVDG